MPRKKVSRKNPTEQHSTPSTPLPDVEHNDPDTNLADQILSPDMDEVVENDVIPHPVLENPDSLEPEIEPAESIHDIMPDVPDDPITEPEEPKVEDVPIPEKPQGPVISKFKVYNPTLAGRTAKGSYDKNLEPHAFVLKFDDEGYAETDILEIFDKLIATGCQAVEE